MSDAIAPPGPLPQNKPSPFGGNATIETHGVTPLRHPAETGSNSGLKRRFSDFWFSRAVREVVVDASEKRDQLPQSAGSLVSASSGGAVPPAEKARGRVADDGEG